jgi:multiple sugar transport system ATP-binding protein
MNFLPGRVASINAKGVSVTLDHTEENVRVPVNGDGLQISQTITLGIRPEHLEFVDAASAPSDDDDATLTRTVSLVEQLGEHSYVHLDQPGGGALIAKAPGNTRLAPGESARLRVPRHASHLFTEDGFAAASLEFVEHYA